MNKLLALTTVAAVALTSGLANAVILKNTDKDTVSVNIDVDGKKEMIKLKPQESYDSKGKDASFTIGRGKAVSGKGHDRLIVKGGKIESQHSDTTAKNEASSMPAKKTETK